MGLLSALGKIASVAAPIVAAPFTGGASLTTLPGILSAGASAAGAIGNIASGAAKGSADQRMAENNQALNFAQLGQQGARDKFSADLAGANAQFGSGMQGAQFARDGQSREQRQAILSSLLGGMQDVSLTPGNPKIAAAMGQRLGGARPSALTGNKDILQALLGQAQIQAPEYQAPTPYQGVALPEMDDAGLLEKIGGGVGLGGSLLGALGALANKPQLQGRRVAGADMTYRTPDFRG
jgi:hypothetical protein